MKKVSFVIICTVMIVMLAVTGVPAFAQSPDFRNDFFPDGVIETPEKGPLLGVFDRYDYGDPDNTHINFFYFMTDDMLNLCDAIIRADQEGLDWYEKYNICSFGTYIQVDVRFNDGEWFSSQSDWDEREYPDEYGGRDLQLIFEDDIYTGTVSQLRDFTQSWLVYHDGDNFLTPYIKNVKGNDGDLWQFDLKDGSMTYRYRFMVEYDIQDDEDGTKRIYSSWSPETKIGKDGNMKEPKCTKTEAPVLSEFSLDVNSEDVATARYYLTVPDSVFDNYLYYALRDEAFEMYGFEAQIRVNDSDWTDMDFEGPRSLWSGFRFARDENIASVNDRVQLRVRLVCDKEEVGDSPWSNIVGNAAVEGELIVSESAAPDESDQSSLSPVKPESTKSECSLCHICPVQPLGICLFVWLAIVLLVIIIIAVLIGKSKKKKNRK